VATGGAATGGDVATGGAATGGDVATGGAATGGTSSLPPQAILQYKFEDGSGPNAVDSTTNGNDGALSTGVLWSTTGRNGGAVSFAAGDASITMPQGLLTGAHALTISAWVKLTSNAAENRLFYFGTSSTHLTLTLNNSASPAGISLRFQGPTGGELVLTSPTQLPTTGQWSPATGVTLPTTAVWKHVTVTMSPAGAAMYIDGKIVAQDNTLAIDPATLGSTTTNLVGSSPTGQAFQGLIDEFYMYNYVLPVAGAKPDDIRTLAWPKTDYSVYHLDEGQGTATVDSSTRAMDGTLSEGVTWVDSPFGKGVMLANDKSAAAQQFVTLANGIIPASCINGTFSAWINLTSNDTDAPVFEAFGSTTSGTTVTSTGFTRLTTYSTADSAAVLYFDWINGTKLWHLKQKPAVYSTGQWTHIAAVRGPAISATDGKTYDGRYEAVYLNGELKTSVSDTKTGAGFMISTQSYLGKSYVANTPGFNGAIDEVLVACRQYQPDEIKQLAYKPN
jgi:hypothetical protein